MDARNTKPNQDMDEIISLSGSDGEEDLPARKKLKIEVGAKDIKHTEKAKPSQDMDEIISLSGSDGEKDILLLEQELAEAKLKVAVFVQVSDLTT